MASPPFDTNDCRRHFRRVIAKQARAMQQRMHDARQARAQRQAKAQPVPPAVVPGATLLTAGAAMQWLQLRPRPFYFWRNTLGIVPIVKGNHQALYLRQDLLRLHAAYLAHTRTKEAPHDG